MHLMHEGWKAVQALGDQTGGTCKTSETAAGGTCRVDA